jgi:hypothetical protein
MATESILRRLTVILALGSVAVTQAGCAPGLLYTDLTKPFCKNLRGTPLGEAAAEGSSKKLEIPTTRIDVSAEWDSRAIGDIAKEHGIGTIRGCDARTQSYVLGIWSENSIVVYGDAAKPPTEESYVAPTPNSSGGS